jgi:hypothetical protein
MPKRNSVKKIITPYELQGSEGDEAYIVYKPPTLNEAQNMSLVQRDMKSKIDRALSDYSEEISKPISELSDDDKQLAYEKAGLNDNVLTKAFEVVSEFILDWNWVDDNGEPLPQLRENPKVLGDLYSTEYEYIMSLLGGNQENPKNLN